MTKYTTIRELSLEVTQIKATYLTILLFAMKGCIRMCSGELFVRSRNLVLIKRDGCHIVITHCDHLADVEIDIKVIVSVPVREMVGPNLIVELRLWDALRVYCWLR